MYFVSQQVTTSPFESSTQPDVGVRHGLIISSNATGSRGDVFVVRTSKPVEIMGYFDRVDDRVTVSLQILYTANQETEGSQDRLRATCRAPARLWLAVIDFQNGEQQSRSGSDKKRRNRLQ